VMGAASQRHESVPQFQTWSLISQWRNYASNCYSR
jgi:hypothetical protein